MGETKLHLAVPLVIAMLAIATAIALSQWLNAETNRMDARNACLSQAIELEEGKTALLQLVASGRATYDDTVKDLLVDTYEIPEDLDVNGYEKLENQIKDDADAIDAYLDGLAKGDAHDG